MAKLILSDQEKKMATYLDWPDETIGLAVKALASKIGERRGETAMRQMASALMLACTAFETNSDNLTFVLDGVTEGGEDRGEWEISVRRIGV